MNYGMFEMYDNMAWMTEPSRKLASILKRSISSNATLQDFGLGRFVEGLADMYERSTRYVKKPNFNLDFIKINDENYKITEVVEKKLPFCNLLHFVKKDFKKYQPKVLIISPVSGHFATLQRDTVERMLIEHDVYITDWQSCRDVPTEAGDFSLDTYLSYLIDFLEVIGPHAHVMAICQPAVQVMALAAVLDEANSPFMPASIIPTGGPIDPRANKTMVNDLAESHDLDWFKQFITIVPEGHVGAGRRVYPGFVQITAFINMNPHKHFAAHMKYLEDCLTGNIEGMNKHKKFYDEYLSVLDMDEVYYLETIEKVFQTYELPRGIMKYKGNIIDLKAIHSCALLTLEGENDDISAPGQTFAAHKLCPNIPKEKQAHYLQPGVGHYGVFSGSKWRNFVAPVVTEFIKKHDIPV